MKNLIAIILVLLFTLPCMAADITVYGSAEEGVQTGRLLYGADAGSSDTYAVTINGVSSYVTGMMVVVRVTQRPRTLAV
jgi:hypothetical protein